MADWVDPSSSFSSMRFFRPRSPLWWPRPPPARAVNGTTGDSMSLSVVERKELSVAWVAAGAKYGVRIVNHIGAASIADSKELAAHAQASGCVAISTMPNYFFRSNDAKAVARWLQEIGAAAPELPLYYYHFNIITGVYVDPHALILAVEEIGVPTFHGFKFTDFNLWCGRSAAGTYAGNGRRRGRDTMRCGSKNADCHR